MGKLGYERIYHHRWNQLFHEGYTQMITETEKDFLKTGLNKEWVVALDSCIKNMEEMFIGPTDQLIYIGKEHFSSKEKSKFRELLETMYKEGVKANIYLSNPFDEDKKNKEENENDKMRIDNDKLEYLNDICDFQKGVPLIKDELLTYFKETLKKRIDIENNAKKENLKKINYSYYIEYQKLKYELNKKYKGIKFDDLFS